MLRGANRMTGYRIRAVDGEIGKAADWLFDDRSWAVRYLVADTGYWLPGRLVLLAPAVVASAREDEKIIEVGLTMQQIEESPPVDAGRPVSRQHELALQRHYGWPAYWSAAGGLAGTGQIDALGPALVPGDLAPASSAAREPETAPDPGLHSAKELAGYIVQAADGEAGRVRDLILDDEDWLVRYILVDTRPWWPGGDVVIDTGTVREVNWADEALAVALTAEDVLHSPPYDPSRPMNRELQRKRYGSHRHHQEQEPE